MNYIGSKLSLLNFLEESINKVVDKNCSTFCDLFAGTGNISYEFASRGCDNVISVDGDFGCIKFIKQTKKNLKTSTLFL